ncbi:MAG TPA: polysaccharide deacetylase family protein [Firmicutes bacterium]|nr:polysaccharide deacetylase family protein [Bacillota bacterium]
MALLVLSFIALTLGWRFAFQKSFRLFSKAELNRAVLTIPAAVLAVLTIWGVLTLYVYHGFGHQPDIYRRGRKDTNMVALTFDDGPSLEFTPAILDILKEYNVPAAFFMVGTHVEKYPEIARRIVEEGHEIGNHTHNHRNVPTLSAKDLQYELVQATAAIVEATGQYPQYVRPPRGMYDGRFRRLANLMGQEIILWTISSRDWRYGVSPQAIIRNVISRVKGGDIILFHDSGALIRNEGGDRRATVLALPQVIEALQAKGLQIVPLAELLHGYEPTEVYPSVDMPE